MRLSLKMKTILLFSDSVIDWDLRIFGKKVDGSPLADPYNASLFPADGEFGALKVVAVDGTFAADGTKIDFTAQATAAWGDQYLRDNVGKARVRGRMGAGRIIRDANATQLLAGMWNDTVADEVGLQGIWAESSALHVIGDILPATGITLTNGDQVDWMTIARATGSYIFVSINGGNWDLLWWFDTDSTATLYPGFSNYDADGEIRVIESTVLPEGLVPSPIVSDDYSLIPAIADSGSNGLDATPVRVGLDGSAGHFDGSDSYVQLPAAALSAAGFNGSECGIFIRGIVNSVDMWTGGQTSGLISIGPNTSNLVRILKQPSDNTIRCQIIGSTTSKQINISTSKITVFGIGMSASELAGGSGEMKAFFDGAKSGGTQTGLGAFTGTPIDTNTVLGALTKTPSNEWAGKQSEAIITLNSVVPTETQSNFITNTSNSITDAYLDTEFGAGNWVRYKLDEEYVTDGLAHLEADGNNGAGKIRNGRTWSSEGNKRYNGAVGGADVILTGDFASDSDWDKGTGWAIAAGVATKTAGVASDLAQTVPPLTSGVFYRTERLMAGRTAGSSTLKYGTALGVARSTNATHVEVVRANGTAAAISADSSYDGDEDDVSYLPIPIADLLDLVDSGKAEHYIASKLTIIDSTPGGVGVAWDSGKSNGIIFYYDRNTDEVVTEVWIAGAFNRELMRVSKTYSAAAETRAKVFNNGDGTFNVTVWYDSEFVATASYSDVEIMGNTYMGEFGLLEGGFAEKEVAYLSNEGTKYDPYFEEVL